MLANIKFSKSIFFVGILLAAVGFILILNTYPVSAQSINIAQSLCAGANLDYSAINNSGACGSGQIEASTLQLNNFVTSIISLLSWAIGVVAVFMIIVGGFKYITSGGDSAGVTAAKNTILYAIIGLVIVALSQLIVKFILGRLTTVGLG
jgi:hypothetical protein